MKKQLYILCLLAFCTPSVLTAQTTCQDYTCNYDKAKTALSQKKFKDAIDYCKAAKAYPNANIAEADVLIYKIFEQIEAQKNRAEAAEKKAKQALFDLQTANSQTVKLLLNKIDQAIYQLEYDATIDLCHAAFKLGALQEDVKKRMVEIAFFYGESNQLSKALSVLGMINPPKSSYNLLNTQQLLRNELRKIAPVYFDFLTQRYYPHMVKVTGGALNFGDNQAEIAKDTTHIATFYIAKTETTFWQYHLYCSATGRDLRKQKLHNSYEGDMPIGYVNWYDAVAYCNWLSPQLGLMPVYSIDSLNKDTENLNIDDTDKFTIRRLPAANGFRLPTEIEWTFSANGGSNSVNPFEFSGSNDALLVGWFKESFGKLDVERSQSVAKRQPNTLNLYDMSGNVKEWCWNWLGDYKTGAKNPLYGKVRILKGGSWSTEKEEGQVFFRQYDKPNIRQIDYGFRVVKSL